MIATQSRARFIASTGGHAPGYLRDLLDEVIAPGKLTDPSNVGDEHEWWDTLRLIEPEYFTSKAVQEFWRKADPKLRARWVTGQLWNCSDIMDGLTFDVFVDQFSEGVRNRTYAAVARALRAELE